MARGFLYAPFQAAYDDGAQLNPADYGHWTIAPYALKGDDRQAIYYSQPSSCRTAPSTASSAWNF